MLDRYGEPPGVGGNAHPMHLDDLLEYLKKIDNFSLSPWVAIVGQTEAMGDPATPSREQVAILRWLGKALELWEKQFPLEARISAQVRRLKPLSAALAIIDPWFLQPGAHPLHQLLDIIQARAIGWQARLDRVGATLEQQVTRAVDDSRKWFDNKSVDLTGICAEFSVAAERDQARAQRMVQRVIEAEAGKVKTSAAKQEAARMINAILGRCPATAEIGNFIKGPWYTSAQLLLLKFGAESEQWQKMSETTATLLDSLQSMIDADEARRQHIFEVVTQLPKEMRRWLLSLHHDTEAVNEAMGLIEFTHLKILRRQSLVLSAIDPIVVEGEHVTTEEAQSQGPLRNWQEGQWFSVDTEADGIVRMQLVLKVEQSQQLVFTNLAGIKVLQLSFSEFISLVERKKVHPLYSGASFSLCLAYAVGIDSVEILNALVSALTDNEPAAVPIPESSPEPDSTSQAMPKQPAPTISKPEIDATSHQEREQELSATEQARREPAFTAQFTPEPEPVAEKVAVEKSRLTSASQHPPTAELEKSQIPPQQSKQQTARKDVISGGTLLDQAQKIKAQGGYVQHPPEAAETPTPPSGDDHRKQDNIIDRPRNRRVDSGHITNQPGNTATDTEEAASLQTPLDQRQINLPMGAWLGFHDGETPLMARLAVHDTEEDYFIFVNRKGVKMRKISRLELLELIDHGMVDILQTNSNFRDAVTEVRKNLDQQ